MLKYHIGGEFGAAKSRRVFTYYV